MKRSSNSIFPLLMILGGVLLIGGAGVLFLTGDGLFAGRVPTETVIVTEESYDTISRVTLSDAYAAFQSGGAVFLDVRDAGSYGLGHVQGALSIPINDLPERLGELDQNSWIITYCT